MANRILRDWTDSETIDQLTPEGEVFFTRLCMKADDYGFYHANLKLLKSALYPLKDLTVKDIQGLLDQCEKAGLIKLYKSDGKDYLHIPKFGQRLRIMQSKFPPIPVDNTTPQADVKPPLEEKGKEEKTNVKLNLIDSFFKDLPNSTQLEDVSRAIGVKVEVLVKRIPDFRKKARLEYPNMQELAYHFKNWYLKEPKNETTTAITFGKKK